MLPTPAWGCFALVLIIAGCVGESMPSHARGEREGGGGFTLRRRDVERDPSRVCQMKHPTETSQSVYGVYRNVKRPRRLCDLQQRFPNDVREQNAFLCSLSTVEGFPCHEPACCLCPIAYASPQAAAHRSAGACQEPDCFEQFQI